MPPKNPQGNFKKVLCVCAAGQVRSVTAAVLLSQPPYNYNTRAAGLDLVHSIVLVTGKLLLWADEIVCMSGSQKEFLISMMGTHHVPAKPIKVLNIDDDYRYMDAPLVELIKQKYVV